MQLQIARLQHSDGSVEKRREHAVDAAAAFRPTLQLLPLLPSVKVQKCRQGANAVSRMSPNCPLALGLCNRVRAFANFGPHTPRSLASLGNTHHRIIAQPKASHAPMG